MKQSSNRSEKAETSVSFQEISSTHAGQRLDNFLITRLKGVPKSRIYRIIRKGEVRVNKKRVKPEYKLQEKDLLRIPPVRTAVREGFIPPSSELQKILSSALIYKDKELLVINKPAGLPVHAGTGVKTGLVEALRYMNPEIDRMELVHRLDKGTSGCLLLARNAEALKNLSHQFKCREISKTYHVLVDGQWPDNVREISAALERQPAQGGERFVNVSAAGKSAQTGFTILESYSDATLLEARPVTGRTHQIRVHAQLAGYPVIGDEKYGQAGRRHYFRKKGITRLCLHARKLSFRHPVTDELVTFEADYDAGFSAAIRALQKAGG